MAAGRSERPGGRRRPPRTGRPPRTRPQLTARPSGAAEPDTRPPERRPQPAAQRRRRAARPAGGGPIDYRHPQRRSTPAPAAAPRPVRRRGPGTPPPGREPAPPGRPPLPVAGDAAGWSMEERLYNQVWGMFEDLARSVAAYRSASDFAESRLEQELDQALVRPAQPPRHGRRRRPRQPPATSTPPSSPRPAPPSTVTSRSSRPSRRSWSPRCRPPSPAGTTPSGRATTSRWSVPMALRLGDLHLPEVLDLRIPMLVRLPLERGLWIDSGPDAYAASAGPDPDRDIARRELRSALTDGPPDEAELRRLAMETAVAHRRPAARHPPRGDFAVQVIDPGGRRRAARSRRWWRAVRCPPPRCRAPRAWPRCWRR